MREAQRKLSEENSQLKRALENIAYQQHQATQQAQQAQKAAEPQLRDDDYADVRTVNMLAEKRAQAIVEAQMKQMGHMQRVQYAELALKQQYPDIEKVLLDKDLEERTRREDPEFWEAANLIQDPYKKGAALYKLMGKHRVDPELEAAKAAAQANLGKPQPGPSNMRQTPLAGESFSQRRLSLKQARENALAALKSSGWSG